MNAIIGFTDIAMKKKIPYVMADELRIREVLLNIIPGTVFLIVLPFLQKYN